MQIGDSEKVSSQLCAKFKFTSKVHAQREKFVCAYHKLMVKLKKLNKLHICWLGPFIIWYIGVVGTEKLKKINRRPLQGMINRGRLKKYHGVQGSDVL
jgi:hypothetical protein